jgi:hypothetical protein
MEIKIEIQDEKLGNLSHSAKGELQKISQKYLDEILDEASRLEASRNTTSTPEITASIINDAVVFAKKYRTFNRNVGKRIFGQSLAFILTILTGGLFKTEEFDTTWYVIVFLVVFLLAIIANIYVFFNSSKNE